MKLINGRSRLTRRAHARSVRAGKARSALIALGVTVALLAGVGGTTVARAQPQDPFTIVVVPDSQLYLDDARPQPQSSLGFVAQLAWVAANVGVDNIAFVTHVGDVVQNPTASEWQRADAAFDLIEAVDIPYGMVLGNHDMVAGGASPIFDSIFGPDRYADRAWYGGFHQPRGNKNSWQTVTVSGVDLLFVHLSHLATKYGDPTDDIAWAKQVLEAHPDHLAFVTTHEFTAPNGTVVFPNLQSALSEVCNVAAVFSGHKELFGRGEFTDSCGRPVHHLLTNFQFETDPLVGYLRTLTIDPLTLQAEVDVYSPFTDDSLTGPEAAFDLDLSPPSDGPPFPAVPLGSTWSYFDDGAAPSGWNLRFFNASNWDTGPAQLGFGDEGEATEIEDTHNGSKLITAYFRRNFVLGAAAQVSSASVSMRIDDGAVVWVNGLRVVNDNITSGAVNYSTLAANARYGDDEMNYRDYAISPSVFRQGVNTIAVEVHQSDSESSDMSFDLALEVGGRFINPLQPLPTPTPLPTATPRPTTTPLPIATATPVPPTSTPAPVLEPAGALGPTEVTIAVSCLAGNGRVDVNLVNTGQANATYRVEFEGLSPRQADIVPGDWYRMPYTGRADGDYTILVRRSGVVVLNTTAAVRCDSQPISVSDVEVQVVNSCRAGDGYLLFQFVNPTSQVRSWVIEFADVPNRSTSAIGFGAAARAVTGRPDGTHAVRIRSGFDVVGTMDVVVDCD